ncbi:MAG: type I-E CRISPR-associated protein Cas6/Cse3/CasE [Cycloclasticus sp.]|jgi:CRISPR system Cascade subunit CasE|nr:type I-E CRISPR-associated protein Cas6/Cse3/CasE [Cycloclasticus sp.]
MYLSKIHIPWTLAKNSYELHQALWRLFPERDNENRDFLFRVESLEKGVGSKILLQSATTPQLSEGSPAILGMRDYNPAFTQGQRLRFRLRVNPIKTIKDSDKGTVEKKGKTFTKTVRVPLLHEEQQQAWLERKLHDFAQLDSLIIQPEPVLYFRKVKEKRSGKIQPVLFEGILTISEPELFFEQLQKGIGPAKAFGCGLLSIAKA